MKSKELNLYGKKYLIFENGDIINIKTGNKLKHCNNGNNYNVFSVYVNNKKNKILYIHRLLALSFIPNPENKKEVNHIDGNTLNNTLYNLEWCTKSENAIHAYKIGLNKPSPQKGEKNGNSILKDEIVREIKIRLANGERQCNISKEMNINKYSISNISKNKIWKHIKI